MTQTETKPQSLKLRAFLVLVKIIRSIPFLHKFSWYARKTPNKLKRIFILRKSAKDVGPMLKHALDNNIPYTTGKMGSVEASAMQCYLKDPTKKNKYGEYIFHSLYQNAGVFPKDEEAFDRFAKIYLDSVKNTNAIVSWDVAGEYEVFSAYAKEAEFIKIYSLDSFTGKDPWTASLKGKKILVISPFAASIKTQYNNKRQDIWNDPTILPAFELLTIRPPFSAAISDPEDSDWFAALDRLKAEMDALDYDVVLVGAGAFSLPLITHAKLNGKIGVHLGGSLQLLFGVYGQRAVENKLYNVFINDSWVRPDKAETPQKHSKIENGCYW